MNPNPSDLQTHLKEGDAAPEFSVLDQHNRMQRLEDFRGKLVLLYFYPEDDTSG